MYIFISHSSKEAHIAEQICNILEQNGSDCFLAPRNIRSGYEYASEILNGIDNSDAVILLLSENANTSPHILREIERAVSKSIPIIVYKLEDVTLSKSLEYFLMTHQWYNAKKGDFDLLLKCVNDLENNTSTAINSGASLNNAKSKKASSNMKLPLMVGGILTFVIASLIVTLLIFSGSDKENTSEITTTINTSNDNNSNQNEATNVKLGDTITFGRYNDTDIRWNVIKISDDGKEAVLLAQNILTFKAFNSAESGIFGYNGESYFYSNDEEIYKDLELQAYVRGDSSWDKSDIRVWLNSDKEHVVYDGHGPIAAAMADNKNGYYLEKGFLCDFSKDELEAMKETTITTQANAKGSSTISTTDRVFLLSRDEIQWIEDANVSLYTTPTDQAIDKNESFYYRDYCQGVFKTKACQWWLRDPVEDSVSEGYLISHGAKPNEVITDAIVSVEEFGIRPAITVDLTSDTVTAAIIDNR